MFGVAVHIVLWLFCALILIFAILFFVLDAMDKVESIQKRVPWIPGIFVRRSGYVSLLLISAILLVGVGYELIAAALPEIPAPNITFSPPEIPQLIETKHEPQLAGKTQSKTNDNSVHVEKAGTIEQQSRGPCSPNIVGGTNSINCGPPPLKLEYTFQTLAADAQGAFSFDRAKCPVRSHMRVVPNQSVPPPIRIALDFDYPITEIATSVENAGAMMGGGPFETGRHAVSSPISPGIGPHTALVVEVCSALPVKLTSEPRLVN